LNLRVYSEVIKRNYQEKIHFNNQRVSIIVNYEIKVDNSKMRKGGFTYEGCPTVCCGFSTLKGNIQGREVNIVISLDYNANYMNIDLANQLLIPEPNIIGKEDYFRIKELQVTIDEYEYISQFYVTTMYQEEVDIVIGLPWFKSLGTFILNMEKKFVTFPYKEKMITLQDTTSAPNFVTPEDFNDISEVILQENKKVMQRMQKEFDKVIKDKSEEISRLKEHSKKLLTQIKKSKVRKQCVQKLEQENQELEKNLSEKNEENSRSKSLNHKLLEQIRKLKEEILENPNIKAQEDANPVEEKTYRDVGVQTMEDPGREGLTYRPKNIDTSPSKSHDSHSSWKCNILQKIELGWSDPFTIRQFCSTLRHSYRLVSSILTTPKIESHTKTLQARTKK
jgi:hypothetical protein